MAFWKIKFGKKKINLFKGVCMFMLTESGNKSFLLTLSSYMVLWLWWQHVALIKESLSGFSFECDSRPSVARSWTLAGEEKEFAGQSISYCFTDLVTRLGLSLSVSLCVIHTIIVDQRIILKFWHVDIYWPIKFVFYYFIFEPKYFLLVDFRSYFSRTFFFYVFSWLVEKYKNVT